MACRRSAVRARLAPPSTALCAKPIARGNDNRAQHKRRDRTCFRPSTRGCSTESSASSRVARGAVGGCVSGECRPRRRGRYSDLDVAIFFSDQDALEAAWRTRWESEIAPWLTLRGRPLQAVLRDRPRRAGHQGRSTAHSDRLRFGRPPYEVLWDTTGEVAKWVEASNSGRQDPPDGATPCTKRSASGRGSTTAHGTARGEYHESPRDFATC